MRNPDSQNTQGHQHTPNQGGQGQGGFSNNMGNPNSQNVQGHHHTPSQGGQ
ncbi:hypothetical protein TNCT_678241, partial [Trichonephila clavata]